MRTKTKSLLILFFAMSTLVPLTHAAGGAKLMHMDVDLSNTTSLQRGARIFSNYCMGCHSAEYMRYNRMGRDLGIPDDVLEKNFLFGDATAGRRQQFFHLDDEKAREHCRNVLEQNFLFGDAKAGETMTIAMDKSDAERFWVAVPPDLSVIARSRGADYLYTYFKTFYLDDTRPFGVNNLVVKNVSMPHVLWDLQGMQALDMHDSEDGEHHNPTFEDLKLVIPGSQTPEEYDQTIKDLVNFLVYMGEPIQLERKKMGLWVMLYLILFAAVAYLLKKEYWRDVH